MTGSLFTAARNGPCLLTDPHYALALAMENYLSSYDYVVSQPIVLGHEAGRRFLEIMDSPGQPLPDPPIPLADNDA